MVRPNVPPPQQGPTVVTSVTRTHDPDVLYEEKYQPCFIWTLILAPCFMPVVWKYHVTLTTSTLSFGYSAGCAQKKCNRSDIQTVEVVSHINGFCDWGGYGIRKRLPAWETGYIPKNGSGLRITIKEENGKITDYTFICDEAEKVARMLTG